MSEDPNEMTLTELRALMDRNAEAIEKLRSMVQGLENVLAGLASESADMPPPSQSLNPPGKDNSRN